MEVKKALTSPPILGMFDPKAETVLETDASRLHGFGFALLQKQNDNWRLIQCGSRFLKDVETRYAMVELEALAILWAIKKCNVYLAGLPFFTVITDHQPLKSLFNQYTLDAIDNPRVQLYRSKLVNYSFKVEWRKGKDHAIPDALSRAPVADPDEEDLGLDDEVKAYHVNALCASAANVCEDLKLTDLRNQGRNDPNYCELIKAIVNDFNNVTNKYVHQFKKLKDELSVDDDLVLRGRQIVIPPKAVPDILKKLHASHQGIEKTKRRARQSVYWPGFSNDIKTTVENCSECQYYRPSAQPEPMIQEIVPNRAFEMATSDLFLYGGHHYLIYADRYSGFPMVVKFDQAPAASDIISIFRRLFSLLGTPNTLRTDGGPQYKAAQMQTFLKEWGVKWQPSSPYYPQSNGHAEVTVKLIKHLLAKTGGDVNSEDFQSGLLELRNSPREDGLSPAQRLFGHPLRSKVPAHWRSFDKKWQESAEEADRKRMDTADKRKLYYDRSVMPLSDIKAGTTVLVQDPKSKRWDKLADVVGTADKRRYHLRFPSGRVLWRNRKFLRPVKDDYQETDVVQEPRVVPRQKIPRPQRRCSKPNRLNYDRLGGK